MVNVKSCPNAVDGLALSLFAAFFLLALLGTDVVAGPYKTNGVMVKAERAKLAGDLVAGFIGLQRAIPTLSPAEREWLEREQRDSLDANGKITQRYVELTSSREWALREVEGSVPAVIDALLGIQADDQPNYEALRWTIVSSVLTDYSFWNAVNTLIAKKQLDAKTVEFIGTYHDHHLLFANATLKSREILNRIVVPMMNSL
jgi:hypothetical protein